MTKKEAAVKVLKLRRLAAGAGTPQEAEAARGGADKLVSQHDLTDKDLSSGAKAAAFDDLVGYVDGLAKSNRQKLPGAVFEALRRVQKDVTEENKAELFDKVVTGVKVAGMFFAFDKNVAMVVETVDGLLKKHEIGGEK